MQQVPAHSYLCTLEGQSEWHSGTGSSHLPNPDSPHSSVPRCHSCPAGITLTIWRMEGRWHGLKQGPKCSSHLDKEWRCLGPGSKHWKRGSGGNPCIFGSRANPTSFADGVGSKQVRAESMMAPQFLSQWKDGVAINWNGEATGPVYLGRKIRIFTFEQMTFGMSTWCPMEILSNWIDLWIWGWEKHIGAADKEHGQQRW